MGLKHEEEEGKNGRRAAGKRQRLVVASGTTRAGVVSPEKKESACATHPCPPRKTQVVHVLAVCRALGVVRSAARYHGGLPDVEQTCEREGARERRAGKGGRGRVS